MKLLVICQYYHPEHFKVSDVCSKLASQGHSITVLTCLPNYPLGQVFEGYEWNTLKQIKGPVNKFVPYLNAYYENIDNVDVFRCKVYPRKKGLKNLFFNYISFAYESSKIAKHLLNYNNNYCDFDNIIVFQYSPITMVIPGIIIKKHIQKPLFIYCFDLWPESIVSAGFPNHGLLYEVLLFVCKKIYSKADKILISSKQFYKYFSNKLKIDRDVIYLPIYAEELFINKKAHIKEAKLTEKSVNLVFAGNIGEMQSVDTIIRAAYLLKENININFHIVGDGSALQKCRRLADSLSLKNIFFYGNHPIEEMPKYYDMADAFLVTLKKDPIISFTLPGKVQSYMAYGKPIIAAIDGETSDIIAESGCGLCCNAEDFTGLAKIILQFSLEIENRQKYGDCSKVYYNKYFSYESFMKSLISILSAK